ncbi:hypothetical protein [Bosea sp. LjRoot237]|uniref:hypothetical protein n=1 Tax=Bosea sp. LjRoot237 TaxID=3342292 RepID=UPI003ECC819D
MRISLGPCRHRGDLRRGLDIAIEAGVDRVRQQLAASGFEGADLLECLAAERKRLVAWADQTEATIGADLPDPPATAA